MVLFSCPFLVDGGCLQHDTTLRSAIKQEINHGEVGEETMTLGENLKIRLRAEARVGVGGEFRPNGLTEIFYLKALLPQGIGIKVGIVVDADIRMEVKKVKYKMTKGGIEIHKIAERLAVDILEIVGIVGEESAAVVGRNDSLPMLVSPFPMLADANVAHRCP